MQDGLSHDEFAAVPKFVHASLKVALVLLRETGRTAERSRDATPGVRNPVST